MFFSRLKPIEYKTVKQVNASAKKFYDTVKDVDNYKLFLPYCQESRVIEGSHKKFTDTQGEFKGKMTIGFKTISFSYDSKIEYADPNTIIAISKGNNVFDELYSKWYIQEHTFQK
jgi:coenzyme Q-binding protein COQ10